MASNGMTLVGGINEIVETIGEFPMVDPGDGSADPAAGGTSIYSRARDVLERETKRALSEGWPENTELGKKFTINAVDAGTNEGEIAVTADLDDVLEIQGSGPDRHRNLVLRTTGGVLKVYDADLKSYNLAIRDGASWRTDIFLDVTLNIAFPEITPLLQDYIVAKAKMTFQRRLQGNPAVDQALQQEFIMASRAVGRNDPHLDQNFNIQDNFQAMRRSSSNDRAGVMNRGGQEQG